MIVAIPVGAAMAVLTCMGALGFPRFKQLCATLKQEKQTQKLLVLLLACMGISLYGVWLFGISREYFGFLLMVAYLLAITPGDIRERMIPDRTTWIFMCSFVLFRLTAMSAFELLDALLGGLIGMLLLGLPYLLKRNWIGQGDIKTVATCGIVLGPIGVINFLLRAFLVLLGVSVIQLICKKTTLYSETPFAPFLLLAALF